jgi:hypothetical protein
VATPQVQKFGEERTGKDSSKMNTNTMRELSTIELDQVGGGCDAGGTCPCPGAGNAGWGNDTRIDCEGYLYSATIAPSGSSIGHVNLPGALQN